jgi:hypothetical protein
MMTEKMVTGKLYDVGRWIGIGRYEISKKFPGLKRFMDSTDCGHKLHCACIADLQNLGKAAKSGAELPTYWESFALQHITIEHANTSKIYHVITIALDV